MRAGGGSYMRNSSWMSSHAGNRLCSSSRLLTRPRRVWSFFRLLSRNVAFDHLRSLRLWEVSDAILATAAKYRFPSLTSLALDPLQRPHGRQTSPHRHSGSNIPHQPRPLRLIAL
ncbi:hypothetical protein BJX68DRAFT_246712 [Aspergillus pseudodeflectus]|uniref:Uncharacterized protein n=1 Tax=Aspergillus pseudodeflectus TaxID=176178 RepID=A0ABR4JJW2_9EURO